MVPIRIGVTVACLVCLTTVRAAAQADRSELQARRHAVLERLGPNLLLVHAAGGMKRWEESGFHQDPAFYYLTGLMNAQQAIVLLDGAHGSSWLFVPSGPRRPDSTIYNGPRRAFVVPGSKAAEDLGYDYVVPWDRMSQVVDSLLSSLPTATLYVDAGGQTGRQLGRSSNPTGIAPVSNPYLLWRFALAQRWPKTEIKDAWPLLDDVRSVKSPGEIALLRKAAEATAVALRAAARAIKPGVSQREVEGAAIAAALRAGSDGPSLWPWIRSGPESNTAVLFDAFFDYFDRDRRVQPNEIVRVDLGFDYEGYKGDFGRTFPTSGRFTATQRDALRLLNGAYLAGVAAMRPGSTADSVVAASRAYIQARLSQIADERVHVAAEAMLMNNSWPLHGLGLDMAEGTPRVFRAGNVICFEPAIRIDGMDLFVEDTFLITPAGADRLNPAVPYEPAELEAMMRVSKS